VSILNSQQRLSDFPSLLSCNKAPILHIEQSSNAVLSYLTCRSFMKVWVSSQEERRERLNSHWRAFRFRRNGDVLLLDRKLWCGALGSTESCKRTYIELDQSGSRATQSLSRQTLGSNIVKYEDRWQASAWLGRKAFKLASHVQLREHSLHIALLFCSLLMKIQAFGTFVFPKSLHMVGAFTRWLSSWKDPTFCQVSPPVRVWNGLHFVCFSSLPCLLLGLLHWSPSCSDGGGWVL